MMSRVQRSVESRVDYLEIWSYIAADNLRAADRLIEDFDETAELLAEMPGMGRPRDDLMPALRGYRVGNYLIFYRTIPSGIELVRILHGSRDLRRIFGAE